MKIYLKTIEEIKEKINNNVKVYWIKNKNILHKTSNNKIVVNMYKNKEKYNAYKLTTVIKLYGIKSFYYIKNV